MASGSDSSLKELRPCAVICFARALNTGSSGEENGRRTTITDASASPGTSTPSQKLFVPKERHG